MHFKLTNLYIFNKNYVKFKTENFRWYHRKSTLWQSTLKKIRTLKIFQSALYFGPNQNFQSALHVYIFLVIINALWNNFLKCVMSAHQHFLHQDALWKNTFLILFLTFRCIVVFIYEIWIDISFSIKLYGDPFFQQRR